MEQHYSLHVNCPNLHPIPVKEILQNKSPYFLKEVIFSSLFSFLHTSANFTVKKHLVIIQPKIALVLESLIFHLTFSGDCYLSWN